MKVLFLLPIIAFTAMEEVCGQSETFRNQVDAYVRSDNKGSYAPERLNEYVRFLQNKKKSFNSDQKFLSFLFQRTHKKFLTHYKPYATFRETVNGSYYNCLTGTALYALLLEQCGYPSQIVETNYHIFLLAETPQGKVLFEATDPNHGFVTDTDVINRRIEHYKKNELLQSAPEKVNYRYAFSLYNPVNLAQVLGLMHYNYAIEAFNNDEITTAIQQLSQTTNLYHSPRVEEFSRLVRLGLEACEMEEQEKAQYLKQLQAIGKSNVPAIASINLYKP